MVKRRGDHLSSLTPKCGWSPAGLCCLLLLLLSDGVFWGLASKASSRSRLRPCTRGRQRVGGSCPEQMLSMPTLTSRRRRWHSSSLLAFSCIMHRRTCSGANRGCEHQEDLEVSGQWPSLLRPQWDGTQVAPQRGLSRMEPQGPTAATCSGTHPLLAFLPALSHFLHSLTCTSWDHLPNKLPTSKSWSQDLCWGNRNQTTTLSQVSSTSILPKAQTHFLELNSFLELNKCHQILGYPSRDILCITSRCVYIRFTHKQTSFFYTKTLVACLHLSALLLHSHVLISYRFTHLPPAKGCYEWGNIRDSTWQGESTHTRQGEGHPQGGRHQKQENYDPAACGTEPANTDQNLL